MPNKNEEKIAFVFPGQGAQYPGMGKDFYDNFSAAKETYDEADELLGYPFSKLIFEGPKEELTLTKNSQLAIFINSIAIWRTISEQMPEMAPSVAAGLSLGEYTALVVSKRISYEDCLFLVKRRAELMHLACEQNRGTMRVVLGLPHESVEEVINSLNPQHSVWVANINCPGQVVIAGTPEGIEVAETHLKEKGAKRVLPLDVSGAFHSGLMMPAQEGLEPKILSTTLLESDVDLVMNVTGDYAKSLEEIRSNLISQVTGTVRWEKGVRAMDNSGVELFVEIGCGKTLAGMNRKIGVSAPTISVDTVADLEELAKARSLV